MSKRSLLVTLIMLFGLIGLAYAAPGEAFKNADVQCSAYLAKPAKRGLEVQWVSGMIMGLVAKTSQITPQDITTRQLEGKITAYCRANPKDTLFGAAATIAIPYMKKP